MTGHAARVRSWSCAAVAIALAGAPASAQSDWDPREPEALRRRWRAEVARGPVAASTFRALIASGRPDLRELGFVGLAAVDRAAFDEPDVRAALAVASRRERRTVAWCLDPGSPREAALLRSWCADPYEDVRRAAVLRTLESTQPFACALGPGDDPGLHAVWLAFDPGAWPARLARGDDPLRPEELAVALRMDALEGEVFERVAPREPAARLALGVDPTWRPALVRWIAFDRPAIDVDVLRAPDASGRVPWFAPILPWLLEGEAAAFLLDLVGRGLEEPRDAVRVLERLEELPAEPLREAFRRTDDDDAQRRLLALAARDPERHLALLRDALHHASGKVREHAFVVACGSGAFPLETLFEIACAEREARHVAVLGRALGGAWRRRRAPGVDEARAAFHALLDAPEETRRRLAVHGLSVLPDDPVTEEHLARAHRAARTRAASKGEAFEILRVIAQRSAGRDAFLLAALGELGRTEPNAFEALVRELDLARHDAVLEALLDADGLLEEARDEVALRLAAGSSEAARARLRRRFSALSWERRDLALQALVRGDRPGAEAFLRELERTRGLEPDWIVETWALLAPDATAWRAVVRHLDADALPEVRLAALRSLASFGEDGARLVHERLARASRGADDTPEEELVALLDAVDRSPAEPPRAALARLHWSLLARDGARALRRGNVLQHVIELLDAGEPSDGDLASAFERELATRWAAALEPRDLAGWVELHGARFPRSARVLSRWCLRCEPQDPWVRVVAWEALARDPALLAEPEPAAIVRAARVARAGFEAFGTTRPAPHAHLDVDVRVDRAARWWGFEEVLRRRARAGAQDPAGAWFERAVRRVVLDERAQFLVLADGLCDADRRPRARELVRQVRSLAPLGFPAAALDALEALLAGERDRALLALEAATARADDAFERHVVAVLAAGLRDALGPGFADWAETWRVALVENPPRS